MFRKGGQANGGITTGLGRQGYDNGGQTGMERIQRDLAIIDQLSPRRGSGLNDFLINFGLNMVGNPPSGNIFQTAATQAQKPFQQFQQAEAREVGSQRKLISDLVQGLSDEDLSAIEEKVQLYMQTHPNASRQEAQQAVWDMMEFSKSGHVRPGEAMENRLEFYENYLMNQSISPPPDAVRGIANHLYKMEKGDYPDDIKNDLARGKVWFTDSQVSDRAVKDGNVIKYKISEGYEQTWAPYEGKIVYDHRTGKLFRKQGNFFVLVEDINKE
jgi:hypothetical protein